MFDLYTIHLGGHTHICTINNLPPHLLILRDPQIAEANAKLISAAPEMLDMLYKVLPYIESCEGYKTNVISNLAKELLTLINKAEGNLK